MDVKNGYSAAVRSAIGRRGEQQDSAFCQAEGDSAFAVVCDGMGGMELGRAAGAAAVERMRSLYASKRADETFAEFFTNAVDTLDERVRALGGAGGSGLSAGTTIVAAAAEKDKLFWLSVGDSRLYIIRGGSVARATRDHNYYYILDRMRREGVIDEKRYITESARGERLISYIGMGGVQMFDVNDSPFTLAPGDIILLCSDGLCRAFSDGEIARLVSGREPEDALRALFDESGAAFGDNATCVVVKRRGLDRGGRSGGQT
ncbi:MAG: serine/threonine-protein phosphatase [Clostridiales bacterium]|jgi:serine/threonine protein phosphatase PrpC|nr:serine/threonine-protein phosphatase [Clostridiales bacterium]